MSDALSIISVAKTIDISGSDDEKLFAEPRNSDDEGRRRNQTPVSPTHPPLGYFVIHEEDSSSDSDTDISNQTLLVPQPIGLPEPEPHPSTDTAEDDASPRSESLLINYSPPPPSSTVDFEDERSFSQPNSVQSIQLIEVDTLSSDTASPPPPNSPPQVANLPSTLRGTNDRSQRPNNRRNVPGMRTRTVLQRMRTRSVSLLLKARQPISTVEFEEELSRSSSVQLIEVDTLSDTASPPPPNSPPLPPPDANLPSTSRGRDGRSQPQNKRRNYLRMEGRGQNIAVPSTSRGSASGRIVKKNPVQKKNRGQKKIIRRGKQRIAPGEVVEVKRSFRIMAMRYNWDTRYNPLGRFLQRIRPIPK